MCTSTCMYQSSIIGTFSFGLQGGVYSQTWCGNVLEYKAFDSSNKLYNSHDSISKFQRYDRYTPLIVMLRGRLSLKAKSGVDHKVDSNRLRPLIQNTVQTFLFGKPSWTALQRCCPLMA